jgi:hypothetical protein
MAIQEVLGIDTEALVAQLDGRGYIVVPGWIGAAEVGRQRLAMETVRVLRNGGDPNTLTVRAHNLLGKTRACDHLATDPRLLAIVKGHLRDELQVSISALMDILPGAAAQPLHRDDGMYSGVYSVMGGLPYPHLPLTVNTVITLDEFTPLNGATRIVPGSKDEGGEVDGQRGNETAVLAACPAGSLIAWSGSTVSFPYACCWHMCACQRL